MLYHEPDKWRSVRNYVYCEVFDCELKRDQVMSSYNRVLIRVNTDSGFVLAVRTVAQALKLA